MVSLHHRPTLVRKRRVKKRVSWEKYLTKIEPSIKLISYFKRKIRLPIKKVFEDLSNVDKPSSSSYPLHMGGNYSSGFETDVRDHLRSLTDRQEKYTIR